MRKSTRSNPDLVEPVPDPNRIGRKTVKKQSRMSNPTQEPPTSPAISPAGRGRGSMTPEQRQRYQQQQQQVRERFQQMQAARNANQTPNMSPNPNVTLPPVTSVPINPSNPQMVVTTTPPVTQANIGHVLTWTNPNGELVSITVSDTQWNDLLATNPPPTPVTTAPMTQAPVSTLASTTSVTQSGVHPQVTSSGSATSITVNSGSANSQTPNTNDIDLLSARLDVFMCSIQSMTEANMNLIAKISENFSSKSAEKEEKDFPDIPMPKIQAVTVEEFNGTNDKVFPAAFIEKLEYLLTVRGKDEKRFIHKVIPSWLKGEAARWFMKTQPFESWSEFKQKFLETFQVRDQGYSILNKIRNLQMQENESFTKHYDKCTKIVENSGEFIKPSELITAILETLNKRYKDWMIPGDYKTLIDFRMKGVYLENLDQKIRQRSKPIDSGNVGSNSNGGKNGQKKPKNGQNGSKQLAYNAKYSCNVCPTVGWSTKYCPNKNNHPKNGNDNGNGRNTRQNEWKNSNGKPQGNGNHKGRNNNGSRNNRPNAKVSQGQAAEVQYDSDTECCHKSKN